MNKSDSCELPHIQILSLALLQGLALFALYKAIDLNVWPHGQPIWLFVLFTAVITIPLMAQLTICKGCIKQTLTWLLPFSALSIIVAAYTGWQAEPIEFIRPGSLVFPFILTLGIASFKALMYIQQQSSDTAISYGTLFRYSWRNFLILGLSVLFVLVFWGILMLWGALFKAIEIEFFSLLFKEAFFLFPILSLAGGFAILTFRNLTSVIDVIANILQVISKFLLPMLVGISIMFMVSLLFTGLKTLWGTGHGSMLILWLQALILFLVNTVYQDENRDSPYSLILHRFIYFGIAVLPAYSVIVFFHLYLRIEQYGWSVARCWGMLTWLLLALFATGYCWGIIRHRDNWIRTLSRVNITMGLVVLVVMLLVNSPLLDFRKISLASQFARLDSGETTLEDFDIRYITQYLARPGYLALQNFKVTHEDSHPELITTIDNLYRSRGMDNGTPDLQTFIDQLVIWPLGTIIPDSLMDALHASHQSRHFNKKISPIVLLAEDLNNDGSLEYISIEHFGAWGRANLWRRANDKWQSANMLTTGDWLNNDLRAILEAGQITVTTPEWKNIRFGSLVIRVGDITDDMLNH